jgi:hypothetical protein
MKLFALLAVLHLNSGEDSYYALDTGISGEDCVNAMIELQPFVADNVTLSCEFDIENWVDID